MWANYRSGGASVDERRHFERLLKFGTRLLGKREGGLRVTDHDDDLRASPSQLGSGIRTRVLRTVHRLVNDEHRFVFDDLFDEEIRSDAEGL